MTDPHVASDASLAEVLSRRARRTPTSRLWIDVVGGAALVLAAAWARPRAWAAILGGGLCLAAYGLWAFAELRLFSAPWLLPPRTEARWRAARAVAGVIGVLAFLLLLFGLLSVGLGRWSH